MDFYEAVGSVLSKYMVIRGRARRSEYWWFVLAILVGNIACATIDQVMETKVFSFIFSLLILIPSLTVLVRRLHDTGKSGVWAFWLLVPIVGWAILLVLILRGSDQGANKYGSNPKSGLTLH